MTKTITPPNSSKSHLLESTAGYAIKTGEELKMSVKIKSKRAYKKKLRANES